MNYEEKINQLKIEYNKLTEELSAGFSNSDVEAYQKNAKKQSKIKEILDFYEKFSNIDTEIKNSNEIIESSDDQELIDMANLEIKSLTTEKSNINEKLSDYFSPKDPNDEKDIILEIRAGTGGEEAELFASDLLKMYLRYAESQNWHSSVLSQNKSELGGIKEITLEVRGENVYGTLKYESGVHRVQRVPKTEKAGRLHTSAATVVVMPEAEEVDLEIDPKDIRIDVYRASGHGGQGVNTTDSAVRITYLPTNMIVTCQDERSQLKNKIRAMAVLRSRLIAQKQEKTQNDLSNARKNLVGSGDRSEKIRTYNFPQNRITDHRIEKNFYNLDRIIEGNFQVVIDELKKFANQNENQPSTKEIQ